MSRRQRRVAHVVSGLVDRLAYLHCVIWFKLSASRSPQTTATAASRNIEPEDKIKA
jgi:hypothetical protein